MESAEDEAFRQRKLEIAAKLEENRKYLTRKAYPYQNVFALPKERSKRKQTKRKKWKRKTTP